MANPLVALVGRPNVGKSTFFNKVAGRKISITEDRPGVTRDRLYTDATWRDKTFTMVDTGGIELKSEDVMWREIAKQAEVAIDTADVILFFTDGKEGLHPSDYDVADILRRCKKPVILVVNKIDNYAPEKVFEFYSLGLGEPFAVSAEHSTGIGDVLDEAMTYFPDGEEEKIPSLKIAVVGKPNAGKSSLVNKLLGSERSIVTPMAGTTRDAVEGTIEIRGTKFNLYDTAGVRDSEDDIESIGITRAESIIRACDVAVFVADLSRGVDEEDARVLTMVQDKPLIKVFNKVDATSDDTETDADVHTSAVTGEGVERLKALMYEKGFGGDQVEDAAFLIEWRHFDALSRAADSLRLAITACDFQPLDLIGIDVKAAWDALGEITGETATEAIITEIFEKFCVGK